MTHHDDDASTTSTLDIRIVGLNTDKTRRLIGSETIYHVYFELSTSPPQAWRTAFEQEWKALHVGHPLSLQETSIDRAFLVLHCPLQEVSQNLPLLTKAVAATNVAHEQYIRTQVTAQQKREEVWTDERKTVDDVAKSLHFN
jgi:hypothetical protein